MKPRWVVGLIMMVALAAPVDARKASAPLEVDLRLALPKGFPGTATATVVAACLVDAGTLTVELFLPDAYAWIAGATRMVYLPVAAGTRTLDVAFRVVSPTREAIVGTATLEAGGIAVRRSAEISLVPDLDKARAVDRSAAFEEKDGVLRYPGRTRVVR